MSVLAPIISPTDSKVLVGTLCSIVCLDPDPTVQIYYATDIDDYQEYISSFEIAEDTIVYAVARKTGSESNIVTQSYRIYREDTPRIDISSLVPKFRYDMDATGVFTSYMDLVELAYNELIEANTDIFAMFDVWKCPTKLLPYLAKFVGYDWDFYGDKLSQRAVLASYVERMKRIGTDWFLKDMLYKYGILYTVDKLVHKVFYLSHSESKLSGNAFFESILKHHEGALSITINIWELQWKVDTSYVKGNIVFDVNDFFQCIAGHESKDYNKPGYSFDDEKTDTMVRGMGDLDRIPCDTVVDVVKIIQGSQQFRKNTDYQLTSLNIEWIGDNKPASASSYQCTYTLLNQDWMNYWTPLYIFDKITAVSPAGFHLFFDMSDKFAAIYHYPSDNQISVPTDQVIAVLFNDYLDPISIDSTTFVTPVNGTIEIYDKVIVFTPTEPYPSLVNVTLTRGIKTLGGEQLPVEYGFAFNT